MKVLHNFDLITSGEPRGSVSMELDTEIERGVQMVMAEQGVTREEAIKRILRDWLIGGGYIPLPPED